MTLIRRELIPLLFLSFLLIFPLKAYTTPDLFQSHDAQNHIVRIANYYLALKEGQLPPALAPTLFGGVGYPIFIFIYPLPYLLGALLHLIGIHYVDTLKLLMGASFWLSGLAFYLFLKSEINKTWPSLAGTFLFTWAPCRFSLLFVRGAFAESFSYLFIATSFLCVHQLLHHRQLRWLGLTSLSLAGLFLSHPLTTIMFMPMLTWYIFLFLTKQPKRRSFILSLTSSLALAIGISAFVYLPVFFERHYLQIDQALSYTNDHFISLLELIKPSWGFGFSLPGTTTDGMSFQLGLGHITILLVAVAIFLIRLARPQLKIIPPTDLKHLLSWLLPTIVVCLLMLDSPINSFLWQLLPGLHQIDFPWRLLGVAVTTTSITAAYLLRHQTKYLSIFIIAGLLFANRNYLRIQYTLPLTDPDFENYAPSATSRNEFLTIWRKTDSWAGFYGPYEISNPQASVAATTTKTHQLSFTLDTTKPTNIIINRLYFPGWQLYLDGQPQPLNSPTFRVAPYQGTSLGIDYSGLITSQVPAGTHTVVVAFRPTPIRRLGYLITVLSLTLVTTLIIIPTSHINKFQASLTKH